MIHLDDIQESKSPGTKPRKMGHHCCHHHHDHQHDHAREPERPPFFLCLVGLVLGLLAQHLQLRTYPFFYLAGLYGGNLHGLLRQAWGKRPDIHSLMGLAVLAAVALGHWAEGVFLLLLFEGAAQLERRAEQRSLRALRALLEERPTQARRVEGEECWEVPVDQVEPGHWLEARAGELVPVDGLVRQGAALVDCSSLNGESIPRFLEPEARVLAGSKLLEGSLRLECTACAQDSTLARAAELIRSARQEKLKLQTDIERWTAAYSTWLPLVALAYGAGLFLFGKLAFLQALYRALTLLVVGSPCALVLAAPSVYLTGLVRAARSGILIKGSRHLEKLAAVTTFAFDKTGTLTTGEFTLIETVAPPGADASHWLGRAASLEARSQHPLALSLVKAARQQGLSACPVEDFWSCQGRGLQARIGDERWWLGRAQYLSEFSLPIPAALEEAARTWQSQGETVVWAACQQNNQVQVGCFRLADEERPEARSALNELKRLGIRCFLLTGDGSGVAARVAARLGLERFEADLLPEDKVDRIRQHPAVAMVGDGVNDAPALATATVGVALGATGSELAIESSDVVLVHSDLSRLPDLVRLARACRRLVLQNLVLAALAILALLSGVVTGEVALAQGVLGHEGSTVLVVLNGLRLLGLGALPRPRFLNIDGLGMLISSLCLVHCLGTPLLLLALPAAGWLAPDERIHHLLTALAVPVALLALVPGYRLHRRAGVPAAGLLGVVAMLAAPEEWVASVGALLVVGAHLANRRLLAPAKTCHSGCCSRH